MFRRQFMQLIAFSSVVVWNPAESIAAAGSRATLVLQVKGFTCITCAVGLDTMLGKERGVLSSRSTYPGGRVTIVFDPKEASENAIRGFIAEMGFSVVSSHRA